MSNRKGLSSDGHPSHINEKAHSHLAFVFTFVMIFFDVIAPQETMETKCITNTNSFGNTQCEWALKLGKAT